MDLVFCFRHPEYRGFTKPNLKCKTCCELYLQRIRMENEESQKEDPLAWIEKRITELSY
ncbi:MAG: hypothetical protein HRU19_29760 [Pseudobacteriovorax sp.]|nr:hypothetical protein [Pseudobacteriovorax sp.]